MNGHIFREYDIRGVVDEDLSGDVPRQIGRAFASEVRAMLGDERRRTIVVGHDNRPSSPTLAAGVIAGARAAGVDVIDVGMVPTPVLYFAAETFGTDGGLQITGSHNPPEYNGFKMLVAGRALYGERIQKLRQRIESGDLAEGEGGVEKREVIESYIDDVAGRFKLARPVKVVADCGNGTGSLAAVDLLKALGAEVVPLYCESDGTFPNHHPDPVVDENLADLIERVRGEDAALGIGFDGDADRVGVVDETGQIIRGDILLLLFGLDILQKDGPGQKLVFDVKCSQAVPEVFSAHGGEPIMWKTGHSLIKEKMRETGAPIAGELSGHICFADDYYGYDDALYAACRITDLVARADRPLSAMVAEFPRYHSTPEIRVGVPEDEKFDLVKRAIGHFREDHEVVDVDGARVLFEDGWGLLRASNTQPVLVLRFEARDEAALGRIRSTFEDWLRGQGVRV